LPKLKISSVRVAVRSSAGSWIGDIHVFPAILGSVRRAHLAAFAAALPLVFAAGAARTDTQDRGAELANSPLHFAKLNLSAPVCRQRLFASMDAQYTSSVQTLAGNRLGDFPVFNATLYGRTLWKQVDISGSVYNLFNKRYWDPERPENPEDSILQNGTTYRVKLVVKF
jgi:hypothetical protein